MEVDALRRLALELLRRQPAAFADVVNGELAGGNQPPRPDPDNDAPNWCNCGHCVAMPTQEENRCCATVRRPCISRTNIFQQVVLNGNVLEIAMRYREDVLVLNNVRNNQSFRHAAYRQYVLWQHGRLGRGNRRVVPSCCVVAIRARYPSPNGIYTGYRPAPLDIYEFL
ncbi:P2X purinoceptor 7-like [Dendronephthya gigantea]|uniref:P2X purinoceptor 7-like n=1 Tax=Dendronephthya gigantea TaxID=151771 RepID=UPI00106D7966|nr:P2X purinoceptor 7-like [Dendronephthya gigantea]